MNVVYIGDCGPKPSGAPISCDQLTRELAGRGWRVRALTPELDGGDPDMPGFDLARPEIEAHHYPVPDYFVDPFDPPPAEWEDATRAGVRDGLERMIAASRPDALLVRELWLPYATDVATRHSLPVVALVRGNPTSAILAGIFPPARTQMLLDVLRKVDAIVTVARHFLPGLHTLGFENVTCIHNAVDVKRFTPAPRDADLAARLQVRDSDVVVLHAAQIKPIKRPLDIVRSAPLALRRNGRLLYLIIGEGVSRHEMIELARASGVHERFRFEPFVDNSLMPRYMSLADLVVMPSEREGLSRVYLEAQACGKTLLVSDIAGAREVVSHNQTGLLFCRGDVSDLAEKTVAAADDPALRAEIGRRARRYVEQHHDIADAVTRYMTLVRRVVNGGRAGRRLAPA